MALARLAKQHISRFAWVAISLLLMIPAAAPAQVLGTWSTAVPYGKDDFVLGGFLLLGEPIGIVAQMRTGVSDNTDIGVQIGFPDLDYGNETLFGLTGDVKHRFFRASNDFPVDLAGDFAFGWQHAGDLDLIDFDFGPVASKAFTTSGGTTLIPYGAIMFMIGNANDDTDLDVNVRFGLDYPFSSKHEFLTELNLGSRSETISISGGIAFRF